MTTLAAVSPSAVATAPLQVELTFVVKRPIEEVFDLMALRLNEWFSVIHSVSWNHAKSDRPGTAGACSERACDFGGKQLLETIVEWEPSRRYAYRVEMERSEMKMPLEDHLGTFDLEPTKDGTLVTWRQYFSPKWFVPGAMLRWQMRDRLMKPAVDGLLARYGGSWVSAERR